MTRYYAHCSLPTVRDGSFTVWSNLDGLRRVLTFIPSRCWYEDADRDGDDFCIVVTLEARGYYDAVVQLIYDCVRVENMVSEIESEWWPE